jgi:2-oxoglutarate dehydrogenase E1 component
MMYKTIRHMQTTRQIYAEDLVRRKIIEPGQPQMLVDEYRRRLDDGEQVADVESNPRTNKNAAKWDRFDNGGSFTGRGIETGIDTTEISRLSEKMTTLPDGFTLHHCLRQPGRLRHEFTPGRPGFRTRHLFPSPCGFA